MSIDLMAERLPAYHSLPIPAASAFDLVAWLCIEAGVCSRELEEVSHKREIHAATWDIVNGLRVTDKHGKVFRLKLTAEEVP